MIAFRHDSIWAKADLADANSIIPLLIKCAANSNAHRTWLRKPDGLYILSGLVAYLEARCNVKVDKLVQVANLDTKLQYVAEKLSLRDYQINAVRKALTARFNRATLDIVMGGGKTLIALAIAMVAGGRWLYLVSNKELANQANVTFSKHYAHIESCTYATICQSDYLGIIVDEAHALPAPTRCLPYSNVRASFRIGMSGTLLDRQDSKNILTIGLLGPVVCKIGFEDLEQKEFLAKGCVKVIRYRN